MSLNTKPLLDWLLEKHPDTPRNRAKQWISSGRVTVNNVVIRKPHELIPDPGDDLKLRSRHGASLDCGAGLPIHPRVTILHLDSALAVVNKGPGLISVPAPDAPLSALSILADFLAGRLKPRNRSVSAHTIPPAYRRLQPLPVHRLDQYTSGVFCMAMNPAARQHLIEQLKAHTMKRQYVAFVEGRSSAPKGTWRQWLQLSRDELRQQILPQGRALSPKAPPGRISPAEPQEAITHFEVLAEYPLANGRFVTKLRFQLETGRKHQIRVQAAHAGLPLIGDRTYNPAFRSLNPVLAPIHFPRQALHAEFLTLEHPDQPGTRLTWRAELPKDLRQLEAALRSGHVLER